MESGYTVVESDLGYVLECEGDITLSAGLPTGFFITLVNLSGNEVVITTPGASIDSQFGGTALNTQWQVITLFRRTASPNWVAQGL